MRNCPNCNRPAMRTEDWACQWCGYPLMSRSWKKIPKTFKELQEERNRPAQPEYPLEPESEPEPVRRQPPAPEPAPPRRQAAPPPEDRAEPVAAPAFQAKAEPEPVIEPEPEPVMEAAEAKAPEEKTPAPLPIMEPERELAAGEGAVLQPERELAAPVPPAGAQPEQPEIELKAEPRAEEIRAESAAAEQPPPLPEEKPAVPQGPVVVPDLGAVSGELKVTVDELNAAYIADKDAASARLAGKVITVSGVVDRVVVRDHLEIRYLALKGARSGGLWNVRGNFSRENAAGLSRLAAGQTVQMRGSYAGYERNILMKDCLLVG